MSMARVNAISRALAELIDMYSTKEGDLTLSCHQVKVARGYCKTIFEETNDAFAAPSASVGGKTMADIFKQTKELVVRKAERFADGDDGSLPDHLDDLAWSHRYACERAERFMRYAAACESMMSSPLDKHAPPRPSDAQVEINPGVQVYLRSAPVCIGTVDGWVGPSRVRVAWAGQGTHRTVVDASEIAPTAQRPNEATHRVPVEQPWDESKDWNVACGEEGDGAAEGYWACGPTRTTFDEARSDIPTRTNEAWSSERFACELRGQIAHHELFAAEQRQLTSHAEASLSDARAYRDELFVKKLKALLAMLPRVDKAPVAHDVESKGPP